MDFKGKDNITWFAFRLFKRFKTDRCNRSIALAGIITVLILLVNNCSPESDYNTGTINILILSGRNNHEWEKTTAALVKMYHKFPVFDVAVNEDPANLTYSQLKNYDIFVSNWNNWPENDIQWDPSQEDAFRKFVEEGGGALFFHAGASSYYKSEVYHKMGIGRWGKETSHGQQTIGKITNLSQKHPITKGLNDFYIFDEIWERTDIHHNALAIAGIVAKDEADGHMINEDAVFVSQLGKGRCFYTILGHNERALFNTGLQTLLARATEWAARGDVSIGVPQDLQAYSDNSNNNYSWHETDTTVRLLKGTKLVWQYNFRNRFGKPYFHPVFLENSRLTCESPTDHVWHYGLWFSWKFINGLNYWEYTDDFRSEKSGYKSEGTTYIQDIHISKNEDYSANIVLNILYQPEGGVPVLREERKVYVSPPDKNGEYFFDYEHHFFAEYGDVTLDRTPILGEPNGQSWGGYGGLSIRFNQNFTSAEMIPSVSAANYPKRDWFFMGFRSLTGKNVGVAMFQHPEFTTSHTRWYWITDPEVPFYYMSPAALYDGKIELRKNETLVLRYRVWVMTDTSEKVLQAKYDQYLGK